MAWQIRKLGEISIVIAGQSPDGRFYNKTGNGLPFYQGKKEFGEKYIGKPTTWTTEITKKALNGDILMSVRAPVGPTNITTDEICIGRGLAAIRIGKEIDREYLFSFLRLYESEIIGNTGAVFDSITKKQIENLEIPLPPLPEQHRIVKILNEVFEKTAKTKENAEKNLKNAKELFESYLQSIFANPGKDWEKKTFGEMLQKTETINPLLFPDKNFIYIDVSSVNNNTFTIENATVIKGKDAPSRARKLVKTGDIIFATVRPTLRRISIIPKEFNEQICSTGYFVLRMKEQLSNKFMFYFLQTRIFMEKMGKLQKGASYPAVTDGDVRNQIISYPRSTLEQETCINKLDALSAETKKLESIYQQKLVALEELKKSVLKKAFAGEL
jgi:type I restriction enzyme, S subunit